MSVPHSWTRDELCSEVGINPIEFSAQAIESATSDLLIDASAVQDVSEALQLFRIASDLRDRLDRVVTICLEKTTALCGKD